jgi:sugar lactone lactonase YvrE
MPAPRLLLRTDHYTEGVVVDQDGTIYFSMTSIGTISRFVAGDKSASVWSHVPAANGHRIDRSGTHIVMSSVGAVVLLETSGRVTQVVATKVDGRWLTYPNDVTLDPHRGGFYVTDSGYKATPQEIPAEPQGRVYRVDAHGGVSQVADGIACSPDGNRLYVGESSASRIWSYEVRGDGSLGGRDLFAEIPLVPGITTVPDGITIGPDERLYIAHYGAREVLVYALDGTFVESIDAGNATVSHVDFAPDGRTMYVSGGIEGESGPGAIFAVAR